MSDFEYTCKLRAIAQLPHNEALQVQPCGRRGY